MFNYLNLVRIDMNLIPKPILFEMIQQYNDYKYRYYGGKYWETDKIYFLNVGERFELNAMILDYMKEKNFKFLVRRKQFYKFFDLIEEKIEKIKSD